MRQRETNEVLIIWAKMFPNDPGKRAEYELAARRTRAKPNPVTESVREQIGLEIERAARGKG